MQVKIEPRLFRGVPRTSEQPYSGLEVTCGLLVGGAGRRLLTSLQPVSHRWFRHPGHSRVMGKKLRCSPDGLQSFDQFRVNGLATRL